MFALSDATTIAEDCIARLGCACERVQIAGSVRRRVLCVRDIDLVVLSGRLPRGQSSVRLIARIPFPFGSLSSRAAGWWVLSQTALDTSGYSSTHPMTRSRSIYT